MPTSEPLPVGLCTVNAQRSILWANPTAASLLGTSEDALIGASFAPFLHPDDLTRFDLLCRQTCDVGMGLAQDFRMVKRDGPGFWAHLTAVREIVADEPVLRLTLEAIGRPPRSLEDPPQREAAAYDIFQTSIEAILLTSPDGRILAANPTACRLLRRTEPEIKALGRAGIVDPASPGLAAFLEARSQNGHALGEMTLIRGDGSTFPGEVSSSVFTDQEGNLRTSIIIRDLGPRKRREGKLEESLRFFNLSTDPMCIADPFGCFKVVNPAFTALTGFSEEELVSKPFLDFVLPEDRQRTAEEMALQVGVRPSMHFENRYVCKDGSIVILSWTAFFDATDGVTYATARDVTALRHAAEKQRNLEIQLRQSQKMESLGSLAGGIAHDMNNVLAAILVSAEVQVEFQAPDSSARSAFETIIKASHRARNLVRGLLAFARKDLAEPRDLNLNDLVSEEAQLLERTTFARIQINLDLTPDLQVIRGDAGALSHVLMNLCVNALDAMEQNSGPRQLTLRTRNRDGHVDLEVEDTGCGMTPEVVAKAMEPFFTTKPPGKGTGLGLSIVYGTMKAHFGALEIHSEPGRGTCILLRFPVSRPSSKASNPLLAPELEPATRTLRILLADDDELVRTSIRILLEMLGHTVTLAASGEEAVACVDADEAFDVVILDLNMPGLGGEGALLRIRTLFPALPILLATGRIEQRTVDLVQAHPHVTLVPKPFGLGEIRWHLEHLA